MPKVKPHRSSPTLDMTPMVDLAFLLVTFFMLTTKFAPEEPVLVDMPKSHSTYIVPEKDILLITVGKDGKVFFGLDGKYVKQQVIKNMGAQFNVKFTPEQITRFSVLPSFGMPVASLQKYIDMDPDQRKTVVQPGIPVDSLNNELFYWVFFSRSENRKLLVAIKGDGEAEYPVFNKIIETLKDPQLNCTIFNLITNLESDNKVEIEKL